MNGYDNGYGFCSMFAILEAIFGIKLKGHTVSKLSYYVTELGQRRMYSFISYCLTCKNEHS